MRIVSRDIWRKMTRIERAIWLVGLLNILLYFALGFYLGGSAFGGAQDDGRYFVGSRGRHLTEVSYATYRLSQLQGVGMLLTTLAAFGVAAVASTRRIDE